MFRRTWFSAARGSAALCLGLGLASGATDLGTVMPLGDSITLGVPVSGGYRDPLLRSLTNAGHSLRFVGNQSGYATAELTAWTQQNHQGMSGYIIDGRTLYTNAAPRTGLYENMATWLAGVSPSNILLMIGSNDINLDYQSADAPARLSALISLISNPTNGLRPAARLHVASIIPMNTSTSSEPRVLAFNAAIPGIVAAHQSNSENVVFVNMHDALGFPDLGDNLHPNATGYGKMAGVWFTALTGTTGVPPVAVAATSSSPAVVASGTNVSAVTDNSAAAGYPYASFFIPTIATNDLIDTNQATLASWNRDKVPLFETTILNDGIGHPTNGAKGSFLPATYGAGAKLPFTYTFNLNTNANPFGYDLTMIRTFAGWNQNGGQLGNQKFQVLVRQVGQPAAVALGTFAYVPFDSNTTAQTSGTMLTLTPTGGVLATQVDQIQFVFMDHGYRLATSSIDGTVYTEADVFGMPSVPPPTSSVPAKVTGTNVSATTDNSAAAGYAIASFFGPWISSNDLVNTGQATLTSWNRDKAPVFESTTLNDGRGHPTNAAQGTYMPLLFGSVGKLPFTYTFVLNTNANPDGYDILSVRTFAGWNQNGAQLGNQRYELFVKATGSTGFTSLGIFTYAPFATNDPQQTSATMMTVEPTSGLVLASGVAEVRLVFLNHGSNRQASGIDGTVYLEADVIGQKTVLQPPPSVTVAGDGTGGLNLVWSGDYPSFVVETSPDLSATNWQASGITPGSVGTNLVIPIAPGQAASNLFYRLRR